MEYLTGMLAAETTFRALHESIRMEAYWDNLKSSWIWEELYRARNYRPVSKATNSLPFFNSTEYLFPINFV